MHKKYLKSIEYFGKYLFYFFIGIFLRLIFPIKANTFMKPNGKYLIIRTENKLGELLLITPLIREIYENVNNKLSVLIHEGREIIFERSLHIDKIIILPKIYNIKQIYNFLKFLRKEKFDIVVDASHRHEPTRDMVLTYITGSPMRIGHKRGPYYLYYSQCISVDENIKHEIDRNLELLRALDINVKNRSMCFSVVSRNEIPLSLKKYFEDNPQIASFHIGARRKDHIFPLSFVKMILMVLNEYNLKCVLIDYLNERQLKDRFSNLCSNLCIAPHMNLYSLAAIFKASTFVITSNSGPMHLSVAVGVPTLSFFFKGEVERWGYNNIFNTSISVENKVPYNYYVEVIKRFLKKIDVI